MKNMDIQEHILGCPYSETKNKVHLYISHDELQQLLVTYDDNSELGFSLQELARVYELAREGTISIT